MGIIINVALVIFVIVIAFQAHEIIREIRSLRKLLKKDLQHHQDWLFEQLYSMSPGKVLKPDEIAEEVENKPAIVINKNRDPMNEFNGSKDDWRE